MEDLPITLRMVVLALLLGINAFFAAAEVALVSVRETRIRELAQGGSRAARMVLKLLASPDRMLSTTQLGVTLASLGLGWAGESTVFRVLEPVTSSLLVGRAAEFAHVISFGVGFTFITFLHMAVGEVLPKNLALERAERLALSVAPPLQLFSQATSFFVTLVERTARLLSRMLGLKLTGSPSGHTAEELKLIVSLSRRQGKEAELREAMLHRAIDFYDVTVREVMVPRQEMVALPIDGTLDQVIDCVVRSQHARIPVYDESPEHVVGVVYAKEIWSFVQQTRRWQMLDRPPPPFLLRAFTHNVSFVPETKFLYELLDEFQRRRFQMAMVVDEFGTLSGLVTVEDALEQIVGEIRDEHERVKPEELQIGASVVEIDGNTNILDLDNQYGVELPYDAGFETLAGFLLSRLGHIPKGGESVAYQGRMFTVLEMEHNRISKVRIEPLATPAEVDAEPVEG